MGGKEVKLRKVSIYAYIKHICMCAICNYSHTYIYNIEGEYIHIYIIERICNIAETASSTNLLPLL